MIVYEQPLTEKVRLFLRLESLVRRFRYHLKTPAPDDTLAALLVLLDLYNLSARIDFKGEIIKEMDRLAQVLRSMSRDELAPDYEDTQAKLSHIAYLTDNLHQLRGQLEQQLREHVFFNGLRQRASLPGGMNGFDIPLLHYWYQQLECKRVNDLQAWSIPYQIAAEAASFSLDMIRNCCDSVELVAKDGFFQMNFDTRRNVQLLQIRLADDEVFYPEISAGKQRFSLRFIDTEMLAERGKQQTARDIHFSLKLCNF